MAKIETRGRKRLDPLGRLRRENLQVMLTTEELHAFDALCLEKEENRQTLARLALHRICPAISRR